MQFLILTFLFFSFLMCTVGCICSKEKKNVFCVEKPGFVKGQTKRMKKLWKQEAEELKTHDCSQRNLLARKNDTWALLIGTCDPKLQQFSEQMREFL